MTWRPFVSTDGFSWAFAGVPRSAMRAVTAAKREIEGFHDTSFRLLDGRGTRNVSGALVKLIAAAKNLDAADCGEDQRYFDQLTGNEWNCTESDGLIPAEVQT